MADDTSTTSTQPTAFDTHPSRYRHWKLEVAGERATLSMAVELNGGMRPGYELKLNSYDLGVDIELCDAVQRLRFEHPEVKVVVVRSAVDRVFCSGANIYMLGMSSHAFKVNFCKYTNETRLSIEDASARSGQKYLAAVNGPCAGGGYELALACDDILLIDDGNSAVSLPEVPLLAVLPGTGGLTRIVDKRKVRRDLADVFCTTSEGVRGKRAVEWGLVDAIASRSRFDQGVDERVKILSARAEETRPSSKRGKGIALEPIVPRIEGTTLAEGKALIQYYYNHIDLSVDVAARVATITMRAPTEAPPSTPDAIQAGGAAQWSLRAFRELDDAILRVRVDHLDVGIVLLKTTGNAELVVATDEALFANKDHWLANEILALQSRVLRRLDLTSKSFFALIDKGSAFAGSLFEMALAADRIYMLADEDEAVSIRTSVANTGIHLMSHAHSRLAVRFMGTPSRIEEVLAEKGAIATERAEELGLVTFAPDEIDWEDDVRIAIEERVSMSPDALTGMEASLRFPGGETGDSKIFSRLSAWQNWIFQRPNAVGPQGALTKYGQPERPSFGWTRC